MSNCSCYIMDFPIYNETMDACIMTNYECSRLALKRTENTDQFSKDCDFECPFECDRIEFEYAIAGNEVSRDFDK